MNINWLLFLPSVVLLLAPIGVFHGGKVRYRSIRRGWGDHWRQIFTLGLHSVDVCRAALGGWLLMLAFQPGAGPHLQDWVAPATQAGIVITSVLFQMLVCKEPDSINAPYAFLGGLLFGLYPPMIAGFPLLFALVLAGGARSPLAFFPILSVFLFVFGFFFGGRKLTSDLVFGPVAILLPWLWTLLFSRPLVISYRAKRTADPLDPRAAPRR